jgi:hypothetical protein
LSPDITDLDVAMFVSERMSPLMKRTALISKWRLRSEGGEWEWRELFDRCYGVSSTHAPTLCNRQAELDEEAADAAELAAATPLEKIEIKRRHKEKAEKKKAMSLKARRDLEETQGILDEREEFDALQVDFGRSRDGMCCCGERSHC